jgi:hypothetical protein
MNIILRRSCKVATEYIGTGFDARIFTFCSDVINSHIHLRVGRSKSFECLENVNIHMPPKNCQIPYNFKKLQFQILEPLKLQTRVSYSIFFKTVKS